MSFDPMPEWTEKITYPDGEQFVCPDCGKLAFNVDEVMACLFSVGPYEARHIPRTLIFTCDNPDCPRCDKDFEYSLSVVITAAAQ